MPMCAAAREVLRVARGRRNGQLPEGPPVWICGDCHVGNLGPVADADGKVEIEIRDLDQTVIGNPAHDLIRLGLSLAWPRAAPIFRVSRRRVMTEHLIAGYEAAFAGEDGQPRDRSRSSSGPR